MRGGGGGRRGVGGRGRRGDYAIVDLQQTLII